MTNIFDLTSHICTGLPTVNINMSLIYELPDFKGTNSFDGNLFIKKAKAFNLFGKGLTTHKIVSF